MLILISIFQPWFPLEKIEENVKGNKEEKRKWKEMMVTANEASEENSRWRKEKREKRIIKLKFW